MGHSRSAAGLGLKLASTGPAITAGLVAGLQRSAAQGKEILIGAERSSGLTAQPRNFSRPHGVKYTVKGTYASVFAYGPAAYVWDRGAPAHPIVPRAGNARLRRGARVIRGLTGEAPVLSSGGRGVLSTPWGPRPFVNHPGMHGHHWFRPAVPVVQAETRVTVDAAIGRSLLAHYS